MIINESYFGDKKLEVNVNDININRDVHLYNFNYSFDIMLGYNNKKLSNFDKLLRNFLEMQYNIKEYELYYRNYTICHRDFDVPEAIEYNNCYQADYTTKEYFEKLSEPTTIDQTEEGMNFERLTDDDLLYAHLKLNMSSKFSTPKDLQRFFGYINKIVNKYALKRTHHLIFGVMDNKLSFVFLPIDLLVKDLNYRNNSEFTFGKQGKSYTDVFVVCNDLLKKPVDSYWENERYEFIANSTFNENIPIYIMKSILKLLTVEKKLDVSYIDSGTFTLKNVVKGEKIQLLENEDITKKIIGYFFQYYFYESGTTSYFDNVRSEPVFIYEYKQNENMKIEFCISTEHYRNSLFDNILYRNEPDLYAYVCMIRVINN